MTERQQREHPVETDRDVPRTLVDVLADTLDVGGRDVVDVGCGDGSLVRWLRSLGARVVGVECEAEMRRRAAAADRGHADDYVDGVGEDLPFDDDSFDVVLFANSLHHVPVPAIPTALAEAGRVLRRGGTLCIVEPAIQRADENPASAVVDESAERAAAQAAIDDAAAHGLRVDRRFEFAGETTYDDADAWLAAMVAVDPDRADAVDLHRDQLVERFLAAGVRRDGRWVLRRRSRVAVLTLR